MRLLACSNSCPRWEDGRLLPRSPGGLIPMLIALFQEHGGHWIFTAPSGSEHPTSVSIEGDVSLHPVQLTEALRHQHYDQISIALFLGLLHYLYDTSRQPVFDPAMRAAWHGYEHVNQVYADRLAALMDNDPDELILLNDPHLMLVPELLAARRPDRASGVTYFLGTPWCEPDYFSVLPRWLRTRLLESLLQCDVVGFHATRWADAFLACCARYLPEATVSGGTVQYRGRATDVVAVPFPLDVQTLEEMRDEPATGWWRERLARLAQGRRSLVRADRLDLWKNIPRGFAAYEAMLAQSPELADECWFGAVVTVPSRAAERHEAYRTACEEAVARINERFARPGRQAVSLVYPDRDSRHCVVAALRDADGAVVNSTYDGLNLFAKEAALLLDDSGTLLLSENAGVYQQLRPYAIGLDPFDLEQTAVAMRQAATAPNPAAGPGHSGPDRRALLRQEGVRQWLKAVSPG